MSEKNESRSELPAADVAFCRRHLESWCDMTGNHAIQERMWEHFMRRPKFNFENRSWLEIADIVNGKA